MYNTDFDVVISGAGPVGLSIAAMLQRRGMPAARIAIIDAKPAAQAASDPRAFALSYGSRQILEEIGAWSGMAGTSDEIHHIHVSRRSHFGRTVIRREDLGVPALGYVVAYGAMTSALSAILDGTGVTLLRPARITAIDDAGPMVKALLADDETISAKVIVQAEGGVFSEQAAKTLRRDYHQIAVVAHVGATRPIAHCAFERFTGEGPLALLPYQGGYALVWCVRPDTAGRLLALDDAAFLAALEVAFGGRVGRFSHASARASYPLGLNAKPSSSARVVAVGNAAQTLHPVAGQGLNLGLRDARVLAALLALECSPVALAQFSRDRRDDRGLTIGLTDIMARIFASAQDGAPSQALLGGTLGLLDMTPPAKRALARQFMFGRR